MSKKNSIPAKEQEVATLEATTEELNPSNASTEALKAKSLEDLKKEFDRLNFLFNRKRKFENAMQKLELFEKDVWDEKDPEIESKEFRLIFASGNYNDKEAIRVSNVEVIKEAIEFLKNKIQLQIISIEKEIVS